MKLLNIYRLELSTFKFSIFFFTSHAAGKTLLLFQKPRNGLDVEFLQDYTCMCFAYAHLSSAKIRVLTVQKVNTKVN